MKTKKILSLLVAMVMALGCVSLPAMAEESVSVAKIGETKYANASEIIEALKTASGDVTVDIYGKVETNGFGLNNSNITKLSFVGKTADAEICVDGVSYIDIRSTNYSVEYTDLILSHINAGQNIDGFLPQYFSTYSGGNVTYTGCTFPNGVTACGSVADTIYTFTDCTFNNMTSGLYSLWIYGNSTNVAVNGGTFSGVRGIKLYSEGSNDFSSLNVSGATFSDTITEKHAIVLTKGESITLTDNTFNNTTGVVQVDSDYADSIEGKVVTIDGTEYVVDSENKELVRNAPELPNAEVSVLEPLTLEADSYMTWPSGATNIDRPLEIVMNFKANDTLEDCLAGGYSQWLVDFNLKFTGLTTGSITANNCYLAGNYGSFGWIVIPTDGTVLKADVTYPVVSTYDPTLNYEDICENVQDFTAAIHVDQAILDANPNFEVELSLVMTNPNDANDILVIGEPAVYTAADLKNETPVAAIGDKKYSSLEKAIEEAVAGDTITLLSDVELESAIVIAKDENITLDLAGYTVNYNSTTQGEAMITNKGTLTINDSVGTGVINYNYTGAADSSYGKGNYTISNAGTLTVNGGKITIANLSGHAKYPIDNNSTTGDAILVINGGHLYNYNTSAIRQFCNSTTNKNSVTIKGGLIEGYCAIWMQNPGSKTVNGSLSVTGGEIKSTAKAYVNGTSELKDVSSAIYCTTEGGAWDEASAVSITGGTINENVYLAEEAPETLNVTGTATFNGRLELPEVEVELFPIYGMNIDLESCLVANVYVDASYFDGEDYYAKIIHASQSGDIEEIIDFAQWTDNGGYKCFSYSGLAAKNMADKITVTIFNKNNVAVSKTVETSLSELALKYVAARDAAANPTAEQISWTPAFVDMLNYGAEAQKYFNYNTSNLANASLGDYSKYATQEDVTLVKDIVYSGKLYSSNMDLENRIVYNAYFSEVTEDMYAEVSFTNHLNEYITETIPYTEFVKNGSYYQVSVKSLGVADAGQPVTITIKDKEGNVHATVTESINGNLARTVPYAPDFEPLAKAMAKFTASAYAALHPND